MSDPDQTIGRNGPCPCGSGKKYKRCCGKGAAPILNEPKNPGGGFPPGMGQIPGAPEGFDPNSMDPEMMGQLAQAMQKMPRGQIQKFQSLMQKAMSGKDVSKEAAALEKMLPPEVKQMMENMPGMAEAMNAADDGAEQETPAEEMSTDDAKRIIEEAVQEGKLSRDEAEKLLTASNEEGSTINSEEEDKKAGGFFSRFKKKK